MRRIIYIVQEHGKGNRQYTLITIVNWEVYQGSNSKGVTVDKQESNTKVTQKKQVADINKNEKNEKKQYIAAYILILGFLSSLLSLWSYKYSTQNWGQYFIPR